MFVVEIAHVQRVDKWAIVSLMAQLFASASAAFLLRCQIYGGVGLHDWCWSLIRKHGHLILLVRVWSADLLCRWFQSHLRHRHDVPGRGPLQIDTVFGRARDWSLQISARICGSKWVTALFRLLLGSFSLLCAWFWLPQVCCFPRVVLFVDSLFPVACEKVWVSLKHLRQHMHWCNVALDKSGSFWFCRHPWVIPIPFRHSSDLLLLVDNWLFNFLLFTRHRFMHEDHLCWADTVILFQLMSIICRWLCR